MKKLFFLSSFLLLGFTSFGQAFEHQFKVTSREIHDGFITQKIWLQNFAPPTVKLLKPEFDIVDFVPKNAQANNAHKIEIALGMERKRPFAFVRIPAYQQDLNSKKTLQLTSFSLSVEESATAPTPKAKTTTVSESVLSSGNWYKISVAEKGIYKIDFDFIKNKLGVDPSTIDPRNIRVYGNGGTMLSENNAVPIVDDLAENAIEIRDGGDNKFDQNDFVVFYANGPLEWMADASQKTFYHRTNLYENKSYYFITFDKGAGQRINNQPNATNPNITVVSYDDHQLHEQDLINAGRFGKRWWGEDFGIDAGKQATRTFSFNLGSSDSATFRIAVGSKSSNWMNSFKLNLNGQLIRSLSLGSTSDDRPMAASSAEFRMPVTGGVANVELEYASVDANARGYLDFIEVISRRPLSLGSGFISFRDWKSVGSNNVANFNLSNANANTSVWNVTNPLQPVRMTGNLNGTNFSFAQNADILHEYIAFDGSNFRAPEFEKKIDNQNLHGTSAVDYIIVTHSDFSAAAEKLANFHRQNSGMRVVIATTEQVYNEFASGSQDIGAIRDFARMLYKNAGTDSANMPRYLLLLGDASYDYKNRITNNSNFVPTYETAESEDGIDGYCSDDYFAFLDDHENIEGITSAGKAVVNTMDLGVGRLPIITADAANRLVDKIIRYASPASLGPWRLSTTILADDGDENIHFEDGEIMANTVNQHSNLYNESKVYVSALPLVSTPGGLRSPDANKMINDQIFKGTFLMNYNGHGSTTTLAHERILTQDDFNNWRNGDKLPILVTATCSFSKYDDPSYVSAGEQLIIKPDGGAIAMLTTTQLVYQYLNRDMNVDFLNAFFRKYNGKWPTFGDAFRIGKNATYINPNESLYTLGNFRKFALLGDPALTPAFPKHNIHTEAIIDGYSNLPVDTLKALGKYQISGSVKDESGQVLNNFNGRVYVTIYDKVKTANTLTGPSRSFKVQNNIIYKGKATVTNGLFSFAFIAPKDINYEMGKGKISYYAENGVTDGAGSDTSLSIGGSSDVVETDNDGPIVKPFMNDSLFRDGGLTGSNSVLYVQLFDESGINVSGNSIGHDLTAVLDDDMANPYLLNDYYETAPNDYKRGYAFFPVSGLSDGKHTLRVKAWDMHNNSGEGVVHFEVAGGQVVRIQNLMNYPNPFSDKTHFVFEHNHPGDDLTVQINIYSTAGYSVRTLTQDFTPSGSRSNEIVWDGTDNNGAKLPAGLYVYRLILSTKKGIQATAYQKLVLIR
ncbi:MAG TPA: type IX secretion system sortase PorU [Flavipsychrobacter sp.]|nr:type IX secretion system sortase PorU [Flavipsychrobacter sp.]